MLARTLCACAMPLSGRHSLNTISQALVPATQPVRTSPTLPVNVGVYHACSHRLALWNQAGFIIYVVARGLIIAETLHFRIQHRISVCDVRITVRLGRYMMHRHNERDKVEVPDWCAAISDWKHGFPTLIAFIP